MHWRRITLVGVGLLGGSLGLALRKRRLAAEVVGYVRRPASIAECLEAGAVDRAGCDLAEAVQGADLVVLCTPIARMRELTERMLPALGGGAVVTDVGSAKLTLIAELEPLVAQADAHFVGSHPMAGNEQAGVRAARADLFADALCVVTPTARSDRQAVEQVAGLWTQVGGRVIELTPEAHDEFVSRSSHLPHIVAAELASYVLSPAHPEMQAQLCANGFRDTTRIAAGSPEMWRDIALANRKNLARVLGVFIEDLQEFQLALETANQEAVEEFFVKAKERRDAWAGQEKPPE